MSQICGFLIMSLVSLVVLASPQPAITAPPIVQRQVITDEALIGYINTHGTFAPWWCSPDYTWTTSGKYGRCCSTGFFSCPMPTGCSGSLVFWDDEFTGTCTSSAYPSCVTNVVSNDINDPSSINLVACGSSRVIAYRTTPVQTTSSSTTSIFSTTVSTSLIPTATPTPTPHRSKAWIAGVAVGAVVAIAIVVVLLFFFLRRKSNSLATAPQQPTFAPFQPYIAGPAQGLPTGGPDMGYQQQARMSAVGSMPPQYHQDMQGKAFSATGEYSSQQQMGVHHPQAMGPTSPVMEVQPEWVPPGKGAAELQGR